MNEEGKIADSAERALVDDWSRWCYAHLSDWPLAKIFGKWSTWDGQPYHSSNYLLLEITIPDFDGARSEPLSVYTAGDEITIGARVWHEQCPDSGQSDVETLETVKSRAQQWFDGKFRTAVFFHGTELRGIGTIESGDDLSTRLEKLRSSLARHFELDRVEVRGPWPMGDAIFVVTSQRVEV